jgi:hypothetical protein
MALSGVIDYDLTAAQYITRALIKLGVLGQGFTASADEMQNGLDVLNEMMKTWSTEGPNLWTRADQSVPLVSGTATYTLSPRPRLVYNARWVDNGVERLPLSEWDRQDWDKFIYKSSTATNPYRYITDKQRASTTITFWPIPTFSSGTYTVNVGYERAWQIVNSGDDNIDAPEEYTEAIVMCLAARLAEDYALMDANVQRITERAATLYDQAMNFDRWGDVEMRVIR